jgi:glycine/D-amino acid oxidase-like deaminating enzyme
VTTPPIERACFWMSRRAAPAVTPFEGFGEADVVVVGAGLTGLWTSLFLKELAPDAEVVILEQEIAAYGASGRNAGMLNETVDHGHGLAIQHFGEAEARRMARLGESNIREMTAYLRERGIACDYEPTGRLIAALTEGQLVEGRRSVTTARHLGIDDHRYLTAEEIRAQVNSPL